MNVHIKIGKKDADLIYWIESLPSGCFSHYASLILQAEIRKKIAVIPVYEQEGISEKTKEVVIYIHDKQVITMIQSLPKGTRAKYIKKVVRKHISANFRRNSQRSEKQHEPKKSPDSVKLKEIDNDSTQKVDVTAAEEKLEEANDFRARMMQMMNR